MNYTTKEDWEIYWQNKNIQKIEKLFFEVELPKLNKGTQALEIGGFPGNIAAYFISKYNINVTILDFINSLEVVKKVINLYNIDEEKLNVIKGNLFEIKTDEKFDFVCSFGFIEHFEDTKKVIERHLDFLKTSGILFCTIPNFRGINGLVQKILDPSNYKKHNVDCMNLNYLGDIFKEINCKDYKIQYFGKPTLWLEHGPGKKRKFFKMLIKIINKFIKYIPSNNSFFSPHIIIKAIK